MSIHNQILFISDAHLYPFGQEINNKRLPGDDSSTKHILISTLLPVYDKKYSYITVSNFIREAL